ncbi:MAG: hemolysin family protein [bacterium]|nr:hemolysin family protein [bacterium]
MLELTFVVLIVLILDGLVSAAEAALLSVSSTRIEAARVAGKRGAETLAKLKDDVQRPLGTLIILSNIITIMGAFVVGVISSERFGSAATGAVSALLTFLVIIFAEIVPKILGERYAESVALAFAGTLRALTKAFSPIAVLAYRIARIFAHGKPTGISSEEEIKAMASIGAKSGAIGSEEASMIQRVFRLNDITARDLMTPRKHVVYFEGAKALSELKEKIIVSKNSRVLVTATPTLEHVVGVVLQRELLIALEQGRGNEALLAFAKKPLFVSSDTHADELLRQFQKTRMHLGVVVNEHGEISGVVTLEDCLEELVGEIIDEKDVVPELIKRISKDEILVHGDTRGRYVNSFFQTSLPETKTLNGFLQSQFHRVPEKGESFIWKDLRLIVEEVAGGGVQRLRIFRLTEPSSGSTMEGRPSDHNMS